MSEHENPFAQEEFAAVPREILLDPALSLEAKGLYSIICAMPQLDEPVSLTMVQARFPNLENLEAVWDEMVAQMERMERARILREAMEELTAALGEDAKNE